MHKMKLTSTVAYKYFRRVSGLRRDTGAAGPARPAWSSPGKTATQRRHERLILALRVPHVQRGVLREKLPHRGVMRG